MAGSELYDTKVKKTGTAIGTLICPSRWPGTHFQAGLWINEIEEMYEGEFELTETENPLSGYGKTVSHVVIGLKTVCMLRLILQGVVRVSRTIHCLVELFLNLIQRVGRSDTYVSSYDLESTYISLPKGDVHKWEELVQHVTLGGVDAANTRPQGGQNIMSIMGSLVRSGHTEVTDKLRREVEGVVKGYMEQGLAEVVPEVVFIDEVRPSTSTNFSCLTQV